MRIGRGNHSDKEEQRMDESGSDLWRRVTAHEALQGAWFKVKSNQGSSGGDGVTVASFEEDLYASLTQLRAELLAGTYRTGPFRKVSVPKKKPGYRILTIPSIRDRVVHTSIATALTPILEPLFEDGSFGYRPNRGVVHAVERIEQWRKRGYDVVIEADIVSFFDNVDQEILMAKLHSAIAAIPGSAPLLALVETLLDDQASALGTARQGIVQGSPLSPLLANLYLDALDEEIEEQGVKIVRFADDFVVLCKSEKKAEKVLARCVRLLEQHNLRLHDDGTRIVSFDKGFDFVGYLFLRTLALKQAAPPAQRSLAKLPKSAVTDEGVIELEQDGSRFDPGKRVLYVLDPTHCLATRNRSFSVRRDDGTELIAIPYKRVGRIEIGPGVEFDRRPVELALEAGIAFSLVDGFGQTKGYATVGDGKRAGLQLAQAKAVFTAELRTAIALRLVGARIRNQRTQLMRLNRSRDLPSVQLALDDLKRGLRKLSSQTTVDRLLGVEGSTTAIYWQTLGNLADKDRESVFRRSRPAQDPLNAAMNYMTAILERDTRAAIQATGLHPGFAMLHGARDRHDGLVYDLMEPFRAPLTEGLAIYLFNAHRLRAEMFSKTGADRIEISPEGRTAIIQGYESAVAKRVNRPDGGGKLGWRAMMRHQAQSLARALLESDAEIFSPYLMEA